MTDPLLPETQPTWIVYPSVLSGSNVPEIGFGDGGFGEDGFDTPAVNIPAASNPSWSVETIK